MKSGKTKKKNQLKGLFRSRNSVVKTAFLKIAVLLVIISMNWTGLSAVKDTVSYLSATENAPGDTFSAATLVFALQSPADFSPEVLPTQSSQRTISVSNVGILGFDYTVKIANITGDLCSSLNLEANQNGGASEYTGSLSGFTYNAGQFSSPDNWQFIATLANTLNPDPSLQNKTCTFNFVFDGTQIGGAGFSDEETMSNTVTTGIWQSVVINKVYYNADANHGTEPANEWIEIYNPLLNPIDISGWKICDNTSCDTIPASDLIPGQGFAVITDTATTWNYWNIPSGVVKIVLNSPIGNGLANTADMLILKNASNAIIDQMNWGTPNLTWPNYNAGVWNPGVPTVASDHMLARVPTGVDTNTIADWLDLGLPQVTVLIPNGGEVWYVGRTYSLTWTAINPNGPNSDLTIEIWFSNDSGKTWANIVKGLANTGSYNWAAPICLNNGNGGCYSTIGATDRIKVVASGPENFMVQGWDATDNDFCPLIDYSLLSDQEKAQLEQMISDGTLTYADVVNMDSPGTGTTTATPTQDSTLIPDTNNTIDNLTDTTDIMATTSDSSQSPVVATDNSEDNSGITTPTQDATIAPDESQVIDNSTDSGAAVVPPSDASQNAAVTTDNSGENNNGDSNAVSFEATDSSDGNPAAPDAQ